MRGQDNAIDVMRPYWSLMWMIAIGKIFMGKQEF